MDSIEDLQNCIKLKLVANMRYKGNHVIVAPLVLGNINGELTILAIYIDGYSKSKIEGTSESDLRYYKLNSIADVEPTLTDFTVSAGSSYLTKNFDSVIEVVG